jgi:hypothetical protein
MTTSGVRLRPVLCLRRGSGSHCQCPGGQPGERVPAGRGLNQEAEMMALGYIDFRGLEGLNSANGHSKRTLSKKGGIQ